MTTEPKQKQSRKEEIPQSLEQRITDCEGSKYDTVVMVSNWAKHLKKQEEFREKTTSEVIDAALEQVLSGRVSWQEIADTVKASAEQNDKAAETEKGRKEKPRKDKGE